MNMLAKELSMKTVLIDYQLSSRIEEMIKLAELVDEAFIDDSTLAYSVNLCLEELIVNIIDHGLNNAPDHWIKVCVSVSDECLEIIVEDDAPPFNSFQQVSSPNFSLSLDQIPVGGLGVHIVKQLMDEVNVCHDGHGNRIILVKNFNK